MTLGAGLFRSVGHDSDTDVWGGLLQKPPSDGNGLNDLEAEVGGFTLEGVGLSRWRCRAWYFPDLSDSGFAATARRSCVLVDWNLMRPAAAFGCDSTRYTSTVPVRPG